MKLQNFSTQRNFDYRIFVSESFYFMRLANAIKKLRKLNGLTLEELADKVGCSKNYIWEIENGKKDNPSFNIIIKIADVLNVSIDQLTPKPKKNKISEFDLFLGNFRKLDVEVQQGIIAMVKEILKVKKEKP
jgi:transcriptional regulator with XRE-family HTH domain